MTATYTFDVFSSLDGFGAASGNWTGYWGKQGPELLEHRLARYGEEQRMVFGANTYRAFAQMLVREEPKRFVAIVPKHVRSGKILVDYLRNNRTNTSVAAFSTRARGGAPVSVPHAEFVAKFKQWAAAGGPCPGEQIAGNR